MRDVRGIVVVVAIAALSITATANAAPTPGGLAASPQVKALSAEPKSVVPFTATYDATEYYGAVTCTGKHQINPRKFPGSRDVETCKSTELTGFIGLTPNEQRGSGEWFPGASGWNSDYNGAAAISQEYTVSANGKKFHLIAYYSS
jgi:hypothetical protein